MRRPRAVDPADDGGPIVEVQSLRKVYRHGRKTEWVHAVNGVSLHIGRREAFGLVGESGSGKSTTARCIMRLTDPTSGRVVFGGSDITHASHRELRPLRAKMQYVFQNPYASLDPRWKVANIVEEPLVLLTELSSSERSERVLEILGLVRLDARFLDRYPHQLSGGQQQRVGIARALASKPDLIILDEPTSSLDALTRGEILHLLNTLRAELGVTYLFISHDLSAVRQVCDRSAVMYLGHLVEEGPTGRLFEDPQHPYTRALVSGVLEPTVGARTDRLRLSGDLPSPIDLPTGCPLHPRCPIAVPPCAETVQELLETEPEHRLACMRITAGEVIEWPIHGWDASRRAETEVPSLSAAANACGRSDAGEPA